jgi:hypothetical protein
MFDFVILKMLLFIYKARKSIQIGLFSILIWLFLAQFTWIWETSRQTQQLWHSLLRRPAQQDYGKLKYHKLVAATLTGS